MEIYFSFRTTDCNDVFFPAFCIIAGIETLFDFIVPKKPRKSFKSISGFKIKFKWYNFSRAGYNKISPHKGH